MEIKNCVYDVEDLKGIKINHLFSSLEDCDNSINRFEEYIGSFIIHMYNGKLREEEFIIIKEEIMSCGKKLIKDLEKFILNKKNSINKDNLTNLLNKIDNLKLMIRNIDASYASLKRSSSILIDDTKYYLTCFNEKKDLWNKINKRFQKIYNEILPKVKDPKRKEVFVIYAGRMLIYFIDSLNIGKEGFNLLDLSAKHIGYLEHHGLKSQELIELNREVFEIVREVSKIVDKLKEQYHEYIEKNPYLFYTEKLFSEKMKSFQNLINRQVIKTLSINVLEGILLIYLLSKYDSELFRYLSIGGLLIPNSLLYNHFDKPLKNSENENENLKKAHDYYEEKTKKMFKF